MINNIATGIIVFCFLITFVGISLMLSTCFLKGNRRDKAFWAFELLVKPFLSAIVLIAGYHIARFIVDEGFADFYAIFVFASFVLMHVVDFDPMQRLALRRLWKKNS